MTLRLALLIISTAVGWSFLSGCGDKPGAQGPPDDGRLRIVATTGMVGDLVKNIGGSRVRATTLMGPGVDPHLYKATPSDAAALRSADMIFYNGLFLEGKMSELFEQIEKQGGHVVAVAEAVDHARLIELPQLGHRDPHIWFDVSLWAECVPVVQKALTQKDPDGADEYRKNAEAYAKELEALGEWCAEQARLIPEDRRILVTSHDAFGYFGRAYGFQVVGLQGISTALEPGQADIVNLVDFIRQHNAPAIFVESSVPRAAIERVAEDAGVKIGGELFSDAMGGEETPEGTYIGMARHNMRTIVDALSRETERDSE